MLTRSQKTRIRNFHLRNRYKISYMPSRYRHPLCWVHDRPLYMNVDPWKVVTYRALTNPGVSYHSFTVNRKIQWCLRRKKDPFNKWNNYLE